MTNTEKSKTFKCTSKWPPSTLPSRPKNQTKSNPRISLHSRPHTPSAGVISSPVAYDNPFPPPSLWFWHSHTHLPRFQLSLYIKGWLCLYSFEPGFFSLWTSWASPLVLAQGWGMAELSCVWQCMYCLALWKFTICYWKLLLCDNFLLGLQHFASHCLLVCISTIGKAVVSIF